MKFRVGDRVFHSLIHSEAVVKETSECGQYVKCRWSDGHDGTVWHYVGDFKLVKTEQQTCLVN